MSLTPIRRNATKAFTLIELLVVIAIIAILAAILFPVFAQARAKARQASCLSNEKQIGTAILSYTQDYDEAYPMGYYTASASGTPLSWPMIIQPYIKNTQILLCPAETAELGPIEGTFTPSNPNGLVVDYLYNFYLGGNNSGTAISNLPTMKAPSQTVMLTDGGADPRVNPGSPDLWVPRTGNGASATNPLAIKHTAWLLSNAGSSTIPFTNADYGAPLPRHQQMVNVLWADGHAKAAKVQSFYVLYNAGEVPNKPTNGNDPILASANWSPCLDPYYGCNYQ